MEANISSFLEFLEFSMSGAGPAACAGARAAPGGLGWAACRPLIFLGSMNSHEFYMSARREAAGGQFFSVNLVSAGHVPPACNNFLSGIRSENLRGEKLQKVIWSLSFLKFSLSVSFE